MVELQHDRSDTSDDVTASEAGTYAFCAKARHLEHVLGKAPSPGAAARRAHGVRQHEEQGQRLAGHAQRATKRLAVVLGVVLRLVLAPLLLTVVLARRM